MTISLDGIKGFIKHGEYLKVDGQNFLLYLSETGEYLVNGAEFKVHYSPSVVSLTGLPEVNKIIITPKVLLNYLDLEGNKVSIEDYLSIINKYKDEDYDYFYPNLEEEFAHRKVLEEYRKFKPIYSEQITEYIPVEVYCIGEVQDTGSEFIHNALSFGVAKVSNGGLFKVNLSGITSDELNSFVNDNELREVYSNSTHSNVHYAKIKDIYVCTGLPYSSENIFMWALSLQEAKDKEASVRREVKQTLITKVFGGNMLLNPASLGNVVSALDSLLGMVGDIDSKQKTQRVKYNVLNKIRELRQDLMKETNV